MVLAAQACPNLQVPIRQYFLTDPAGQCRSACAFSLSHTLRCHGARRLLPSHSRQYPQSVHYPLVPRRSLGNQSLNRLINESINPYSNENQNSNPDPNPNLHSDPNQSQSTSVQPDPPDLQDPTDLPNQQVTKFLHPLIRYFAKPDPATRLNNFI